MTGGEVIGRVSVKKIESGELGDRFGSETEAW